MCILDVTDWEKEEYGIGTRKKYLYVDPKTRQKAFFKYPMIDERTGGKILGEVWSEKIAAEIGRIIEIPTPKVAIAKNEDGYGSLSYNFLKEGEQLHHGADFLSIYFEAKSMGEFNPRDIKHHSLDSILTIAKALNVVHDLIDILIFDALIGNTDRHSENWGLISNSNDNTFRLAPAYDNSSSLAREFNSDEIKKQLIEDNNRFNKYVFGKKSAACIALGKTKRTQHFELVSFLLKLERKHVRDTLKRMNLLNDTQIDKILSGIPSIIMNKISKELVKKILIARRDTLLLIRG